MMGQDNIPPGFEALQISPQAIENILPQMLQTAEGGKQKHEPTCASPGGAARSEGRRLISLGGGNRGPAWVRVVVRAEAMGI
jgi:hypothetical protein